MPANNKYIAGMARSYILDLFSDNRLGQKYIPVASVTPP
jgi:hypothetical protein